MNSTDRMRLLDLPKGRILLTAYVGRFGKTSVGRTVLLRRIHYGGHMILDHQWFRAGKWSDHLHRYDIVTLNVRGLEKYSRGYNGRNSGEAYGLNTPLRANTITPPGFMGLIIKRIDETMVHLDEYDIEAVCKLLRREQIIIHTNFQKAIEKSLAQFVISNNTADVIAGYLTNRQHQYGSQRVSIQAIRRAVARTTNNAQMARRQSTARTDDVGAGAL